MKKNLIDMVLSEQQLEKELQRTVHKKQRWSIFRNILAGLFLLSSLIMLLSAIFFPVHQVTDQLLGTDLKQGQFVATWRVENLKSGDLAVLRYDNKILMRCVIGEPADIIQKDARGNLSVNGVTLPEGYLSKPILQAADITYPFQVPDNSYCVLDGNQTLICVSEENIIGKILFRIWPLSEAGFVR